MRAAIGKAPLTRHRLPDAARRLAEALDAVPAAAEGWRSTERGVREGYLRWVAQGWTRRERRLRAEATAAAAVSGSLRWRPGPTWGDSIGAAVANLLDGV